ncbi:MAG: amidohydrolase [Gemmataceae bacterium]|nr:amidohydrolase [Gemmataceae bacterium]MCI0741084.1 amidohydrolase [Gemmataceae bacterium]
MKNAAIFVLVVVTHSLLPALTTAQVPALIESIDRRADASWEMARKIWEWAETGYKEKQSAALLADALEKAGFKVVRGVAGIPTAFTATIGSGKPVIGIMGEYDALPGLSQDAVPFRKPVAGSGNGHGCGHHLFGVAALSACLALGEQIQAGKLKGTLRFYGCPAEEGGSARVFMVREGLFKDCDIALHWHPASINSTGSKSNMARIAVKFRFHGASAHAAGAPDKGRSALDAVELTNHAAQLLREHTPDLTRIHHVITDGGGAPNVVPDFSEVFYYVRHPEAEVAKKVYERLLKCAQAGALATETKLEVIYLGGTVQLVPNDALGEVFRKHLKSLCDLKYNDEERQFAVRIQETLQDKPALENAGLVYSGSGGGVSKGSTDVSDVSWVVPTGGFSTACWVPGTPGHSWQATAAGGMSIGKKGMHLAAKVMAAGAFDLFQDSKLIDAARAEFRQRLTGRTYQSLLLPGQQPPLNYRDPPRKLAVE